MDLAVLWWRSGSPKTVTGSCWRSRRPAGSARRRTGTSSKGLLERGLSGTQIVISDDHESIRQAVAAGLAGVKWQRRSVHFERNVLAHVSAKDMEEVADDFQAVFAVKRKETAHRVFSLH